MKIEQKGDEFVITDFDELETYKIAAQIEKGGIEFYENLLESVGDAGIEDKIKFLINEERKHLKFFEGRLYEIGKGKEDGFEEDNLLSYIEYGIFDFYKSIKDMGDVISDVKKAMQLAIFAEEDSVRFYKACGNKVTSPKTKDELQVIIEEEKKHKALFEKLLNEI